MNSIGSNIKNQRLKKGMTQKDLATVLCVTAQAVSRWENDEVEPSVAAIRQMAELFECSIDDLFNTNDESKEATEEIVEENKVEEPIEKPVEVKEVIVERIVEVQKEEKPQVLTLCSKCDKPLYAQTDIYKLENKVYRRSGRSSYATTEEVRVCKDCYDERQRELEEERVANYNEKVSKFRKRRIWMLIVVPVLFALFVALAIYYFINSEADSGLGALVIGVLASTFIGSLILGNNFLSEVFLTVASWGFVRFPGIIFSFDLDGLKFLIVMKLLFFVIGMILVVAAFLFAVALCLVLSIISYPLALYRNIKMIEVD